MTALFTLWVSGLAIAGFGAFVLFDASLGLNWALWMLLAAAGLALCGGVAQGRPPAAVWAPLGLACALAAGAPLTTDKVFDVLIVMGGLLLLSAAMLVARNPATGWLDVPFVMGLPAVAAVVTLTEAARRGLELQGVGERPEAAFARGIQVNRQRYVYAILGGSLLLASGAFERWAIFKAGSASARDPKYTVVPQRARIEARASR